MPLHHSSQLQLAATCKLLQTWCTHCQERPGNHSLRKAYSCDKAALSLPCTSAAFEEHCAMTYAENRRHMYSSTSYQLQSTLLWHMLAEETVQPAQPESVCSCEKSREHVVRVAHQGAASLETAINRSVTFWQPQSASTQRLAPLLLGVVPLKCAWQLRLRVAPRGPADAEAVWNRLPVKALMQLPCPSTVWPLHCCQLPVPDQEGA